MDKKQLPRAVQYNLQHLLLSRCITMDPEYLAKKGLTQEQHKQKIFNCLEDLEKESEQTSLEQARLEDKKKERIRSEQTRFEDATSVIK